MGKSKKGYVLATTAILMSVIIILSVVVMLLVQSFSLFDKRQKINFEYKLKIEELANCYNGVGLDDFVQYLLDDEYLQTSSGTYEKASDNVKLVITTTTNDEEINIYKSNGEQMVCEMLKHNGDIVLWKYYI